MNKDLKNKLLVLATAAGLAGFGVACGGEAPAAEEGESTETAGGEGEGSCAGAEPAEEAGDEGAAEEAGDEGAAEEGGEGSCGEGSCS